MHYLTFAQEAYDICDVRVVGHTQYVVVCGTGFLLCRHCELAIIAYFLV